MTVEIKRVEGRADLYCKYDGQHHPQATFVELDPGRRTVRADYAADDMQPVALHNGDLYRWYMPKGFTPTAETANDLMASMASDLGRMCDLYSASSADTSGLYLDIDAKLHRELDTIDGGLIVWDAGEYLAPCDDEELDISAESTDEELSDLADQIRADAQRQDGVDLLLDLEDELQYRRDKLIVAQGI